MTARLWGRSRTLIIRGASGTWQKLNVTAFLASGMAQTADVVGEPYRDADGTEYTAMFRQPVLVFSATAEELARTLERTLSRSIQPAIFTSELFETGHDAANRAAVAAVPRAALDLVGLAVRAERRDVDRIVKGLRLHD